MCKSYLTTYAPLVASPAGREACEVHGLPPFVDGSIRREPDLEHESPGISCLCRADKFAPRLNVGDTVGYMTAKNGFGRGKRHRRLTAVLLVREVFPTHKEAAEWYRGQDLPLPSNCMVPGNAHKPLAHSHRLHVDSKKLGDAKLARRWDGQYRLRAKRYGVFVVCHPLFRELNWNAPIVGDEQLIAAFGKVPGTQNPGKLPETEFRALLQLLGISAPPFAP